MGLLDVKSDGTVESLRCFSHVCLNKANFFVCLVCLVLIFLGFFLVFFHLSCASDMVLFILNFVMGFTAGLVSVSQNILNMYG